MTIRGLMAEGNMNITIEKLSKSNMADFFDFFDNRAFSDGSPFAPCYCNEFYLTPEEVCDDIGKRTEMLGGGFEGFTLALKESAKELIEKGIMQGYLAYEGGISVGWCNANDRQNYVRAGSFVSYERRDEDYYISDGEHGKVKSLVCFEIAPEYRGKGIAKALLQQVCKDAESDGYEFVEAYPQMTEKYSVRDFAGPEEMYRHFGFEETERHGSTVVMRKKLS